MSKSNADLLYIIDALLIFSILISDYVLYIDIFPKILLYIVFIAISINFFFMRIHRYGSTSPLWIIPILRLVLLLGSNFLNYRYGLFILYISTIIFAIFIKPSIISRNMWHPELILVSALASLIILLIFGYEFMTWIVLGPLAELLLLTALGPGAVFNVVKSNSYHKVIGVFNSVIVSILPNIPIVMVFLPMFMNSLKMIISDVKLSTILISLDHISRLVFVVVILWSIGI